MLRERLDETLKTAMRSRDAVTLSVVRQVKAGILAQETRRERTTLDDDGIRAVIAKEIKERRDAIPDFVRGGRQDLADKFEAEIAALQQFLPPPLSGEELGRLVDQAVEATGAEGPRDLGKVMGWLSPRTRGRADGKTVSDCVRQRLGS